MILNDVGQILYSQDSISYPAEYSTTKVLLTKNGISSEYTNNEWNIPLSTLKGNSSFSIIVFFLKNKGLSFKNIAEITNRDERTIWSIYNKFSKKKTQKQFILPGKSNIGIIKESPVALTNESINLSETDLESSSEIFIPLEIITARKLSVLESIVFYLITECGLTITQIASCLDKNYRTIYTVYKRALLKNE